MPELPEVEVLRRSLEPLLVGDVLERAEILAPALREPLDRRRLMRQTRGQRVARLRRRAKYLLIDLDNAWSLVIHLGMSGRLTIAPPGTEREPHEHAAFHLASGGRLRLRDPRRFGQLLCLRTKDIEGDRHFAHLGVEPLSDAFSGEHLAASARGRRGPIKTFIMDAKVVVGVGNIYAAEALYKAGIHPNRSVARIARARWDRLAETIREVLGGAITEGGTTLNDFTDGEGNSGYFQVSLEVYGREGEPCRRCGAAVKRSVHANRSTFYCPGCQR